ncbi:MAG: adenosylcobinamide-phosphate synthase CbiB [Parvibaculum sp.]|uniref:adenosylcobinamide-phosphate synthase CbiB n=1 Tax=Parvibaculum sp. TaxID=2024848 RepID=UPI0025F0D6ED|nr:adenosylcobinamide-phosphate synthase CbiB [Parvibaculum sp.]MCE9649047.1 adenosylcobinamide-phosphate synthase CbiB [Parvibaculum sp.]
MTLAFPLALAAFAIAIEAASGYPQVLYRALGHPVTWIGALIARLDASLNRDADSFAWRRAKGVVSLFILLAIAGGGAVALQVAVRHLPLPIGFALLAIAASSLVAQRSLHDHVRAVADALDKGGVEAGREAVSMIVGRDTGALDLYGVSRAAIESLAENFSDGVVAPVFWLGAGGLPGGVIYKTINTADSMIGHRSERHFAYGWAAARLDDLVNLPASRLAALFIALAASATHGADAGRAVKSVFRDARHHKSPNAGWPEAAMAGALGLKIAGPRSYHGQLTEDHWMGDGRAEATANDIRRALTLYRRACAIEFGLVAALATLLIARG